MKYLALWSPGLQLFFFEKFVKPSSPHPTYLMYAPLGQDSVHKFIINMVEQSNYCNCEMKKYFNKQIVMTKDDNKNFESSTNC